MGGLRKVLFGSSLLTVALGSVAGCGQERLSPGAARGRQVYLAQCVACHTFGRGGGRVGPDLSGIRNQPADTLLLHILVPDYEITPGYESYTVQTRDGRTLIGRLESETAASLTIRDAAGEAHVVLRSGVAGHAKLQFRVEAFNLFNRDNFAPPAGNRSAANFGTITSTFDARQVQLGVSGRREVDLVGVGDGDLATSGLEDRLR